MCGSTSGGLREVGFNALGIMALVAARCSTKRPGMTSELLPELLGADAAAALLGIGRRTLYNLRSERAGFPRPVELREGMPRYRRADLLAYVASLTPIDTTTRGEPAHLAAAKRAAPVKSPKRKTAARR